MSEDEIEEVAGKLREFMLIRVRFETGLSRQVSAAIARYAAEECVLVLRDKFKE